MGPIVSVVLGEACAPPWGSLRYVLEREGFTVVGHVSDPSQLDRILVSVDPTVIVLDAEMGAMPVLAARKKAPDARIVVVWPWGVSPAIADAGVDPTHARQDLGDAVRRATRSLSLEAPEPEPEPAAIAPVLSIVEGPSASDLGAPRGSTRAPSSRGSGLRRAGLIAALVAASLGVLVAGALGLTRPNHPAVSGHKTGHGSATSSTAARPALHRSSQKADRGCSGRVSPAGGAHGAGRDATTARGQTTRVDACRSHGAHARKENPGRHVGPNPSVHANGHRPDSPGRSADKGKSKGTHRPR